MNKVFLVGNLTRDPETRTLGSGVTMCTFSIAVNRRFANANGTREADFLNIVTWRQLAETCSRYLAKGRKVSVIGSIQTRSYDAQDGSKRHVTEIVADEVEFLTAAGASAPRDNGGFDSMPIPPENPVEAPIDDGELPF